VGGVYYLVLACHHAFVDALPDEVLENQPELFLAQPCGVVGLFSTSKVKPSPALISCCRGVIGVTVGTDRCHRVRLGVVYIVRIVDGGDVADSGLGDGHHRIK
jgi:hypothetical protein